LDWGGPGGVDVREADSSPAAFHTAAAGVSTAVVSSYPVSFPAPGEAVLADLPFSTDGVVLRRVDVHRSRYYVAKRGVDFLVASLLLLILSPLLVAIAIAIKLDSPGPVVFRQQRVRGRRVDEGARDGWVTEPFTLYKFRTMKVDADPTLHRDYMAAYLTGDEERLTSLRPGRKPGDSYRPAHDPRVTRVGAVLRKLSLDELPQLWNVLLGQMSLVGPRPPLSYEVVLYRDHHLQRLAGPPGVTGWAQVKGRSGIDFEETVQLDVEYLSRQSIWHDLKVLLLTVPAVLMARGAD
jgi:lipopolysaccharide/colanic/teichoic acid biosynthesis glycosyltransferase